MKKIIMLLVLAVAACANVSAQRDRVQRFFNDFRRETAKAEIAEQNIKRVASQCGYDEYRNNQRARAERQAQETTYGFVYNKRDYKFDMTTTIRSRVYNKALCLDVIADDIRITVDEYNIFVYRPDGVIAAYSRFADIGRYTFENVTCGRYSNVKVIVSNSSATTEVRFVYDGPRAITFKAWQPKRYQPSHAVRHRSTARCRY